MISAYEAYDTTSKYHADILSPDRIEKCLDAINIFIINAINKGEFQIALSAFEVSMNHVFTSKEAILTFLNVIKFRLEDFGYRCEIIMPEYSDPCLEISWLKPNPSKC